MAGCVATPPETAGPVPVPTVTVTATPAPEPQRQPITCDTAFTADRIATILNDGLTFRGAGSTGDIDEFVGGDGLRCQWARPGTDAVVRYANWERDATAWEALKTRLLVEGYFETGPSSISRLTADLDGSYSFRDGVVHYVRPWVFIGWATGLQ
jgi:hypothetical protein